MTQTRRRRTRAEPWNFTKHGTYGVFVTADSIPIEYLQTSFRPDELIRLSLARDVRQKNLDFEMLMQRDLDEDRAENTLTKYLVPRGSDRASSGSHSVFFPPLLIACVPSFNSEILNNYPDEVTVNEVEDGRLIRRWGDMFQLDFITEDPVDPYELEIVGTGESISVDVTDVEAKFNISQRTEPGVKLIAIDGQHRLWALRHLSDDTRNRDMVSKLVVPVCVLFSTATSEAVANRYQQSGVSEILDVPKTFRKVFVDVNSKAESVGAHTNILLDDMNVGSLIVREFCDQVNTKRTYGLSCIEWNVKKTKEARQLTRDHSITSVGILEKALRECFSRRNSLMNRLLDIEDAEVRQKLVESADDPDIPKIDWTSFSIAQRRILVERARGGIVNVLFRIFFDSDSYSKAYENYKKQINEFEKRAAPNQDDSSVYRQALEAVLSRFSLPKKDSEAYEKVREFGKNQKEWRKTDLCPVLDFALFQRAIFLTLKELMDALPDVSIRLIGSAVVELLNVAMAPKLGLFDKQRTYTRMAIWQDSTNVVNKEQTRWQMSRLLVSVLGGADSVIRVTDTLELDEDDRVPTRKKLMELGQERAGEYLQQYTHERLNYFKKSFETNFSLTEEEVDELREARKNQDAETERIRAKDLAEEHAERPFDEKVRIMLSDEFSKAEEDLRKALKFDKRIVGSESEAEDNGDYE